MSKSSDRPNGSPPDLRRPEAFDMGEVREEPVTVPATQDPVRPPPPAEAPPRRPFEGSGARESPDPDAAQAPIVPAGSVTGRSLTMVVSIMCFLACLTVGAVYIMRQSAAAWQQDIASEVTVQVEAREGADVNTVVEEVAKFLRAQKGVRNVKPLTPAQSKALLEPWIGHGDVLSALPVPRLIALEIDRSSSARDPLDTVRKGLAGEFKGVMLDDHRQWLHQIKAVTRSFALGGIAILLLVGAATTAIIISATRSAMASNRDIVEVLNFIGATDRFIAREFERHFLRLGIRAGVVGAGSAMAIFFVMPWIMELLGGGTVTLAELRRLVGSAVLDIVGYGVLALVVVVIAALCMLTSRFGVYRILHSQH
ncbi:MAG: cell division protein FtsX [Hyphomicrobiaceae bacterium]